MHLRKGKEQRLEGNQIQGFHDSKLAADLFTSVLDKFKLLHVN